MGFLGEMISSLFGMAFGGNTSLRAAYVDKRAPQAPGVYKIYLDGQLMKVGKAENGLRKRFSDYYRGVDGGTAGLYHITDENRDRVMVRWQECSIGECRRIEKDWYDEAERRGEDMPWSSRR